MHLFAYPRAGVLLAGLLSLVALSGAGTEPSRAPVPDFSGPWQRMGAAFDFAPPLPGTGPGPLVNISGNRLVPVGNHDSPLLRPWAAADVKKHGDLLLSGKLAPDAHTSCQFMGVPYVLQVRGNVQLLQTPEWIMITYENDNQRRLVRLDTQHSAHPAPTWMGESIGRYEGDTLVIDTIGIAVHEVSAIDRFGTPHTEAMHVIERYRVSDDRRNMRVDFTVEDPGTFTMPWHASVVYGLSNERPGEHICAENIRDFGAGGVVMIPVPTAAKPDF
jgi:hypothetical protein